MPSILQVMRIKTEPLFNRDGVVYMVLKRYDLDTTKLPIEQAKSELTNIIASQPDANATWGYFPEITDTERDYTNCKLLGDAMQSITIADDTIPTDTLSLAFVRLATSEPESKFGGFHVDVSPGIAHARSKDAPTDSNILRILFNVYDKPRKLEFYPHTADELRAQGHDIPAQEYKILQFPDSLKTQTIEIPPMTATSVYCLQFLSNRIPHAGRTYQEGHFLVSFGGYIPASYAV